MSLKIVIFIIFVAFQIFVGITKDRRNKGASQEGSDESLEPVETEENIPEIFKKIFQTEEKIGNTREGSNLPPPVPSTPIEITTETSPRTPSYGDFAAYNELSYQFTENEAMNNKEIEVISITKKEDKKKQPEIMKNFNLEKAVIYSEIMTPKYKEY